MMRGAKFPNWMVDAWTGSSALGVLMALATMALGFIAGWEALSAPMTYRAMDVEIVEVWSGRSSPPQGGGPRGLTPKGDAKMVLEVRFADGKRSWEYGQAPSWARALDGTRPPFGTARMEVPVKGGEGGEVRLSGSLESLLVALGFVSLAGYLVAGLGFGCERGKAEERGGEGGLALEVQMAIHIAAGLPAVLALLSIPRVA